ncbi:MAG: hypothetical protein P1Q69_06995 [Candidatus Thorarchaeota archaeon]|nr:hypothetical protein [Candidatus Thorarchaeota archaeon]
MNILELNTGFPILLPNIYSTVNGMAWAWDETKFSTFVTTVWQNYSPNTGEYFAVTAEWFLDREEEILYLEYVSVKRPYSPSNEYLIHPASYVSPRHRKFAKKIAVQKLGKRRMRLLPRYYPKEVLK